MYLSIYSDRETAQRSFPRRTKGPETWADSDSWSLPLFRGKSHVRPFPATNFNPQVILCSSEQCLEEGREWLLPSLLSHLPGKGGEQLSPPQPLTSHLPTTAEVRAQWAPVQGRSAHKSFQVWSARGAWQVTTLAGELGPPCCSLHLPPNPLSAWQPVHTSWKEKGCSSNMQQLRHVPVYPDLHSSTDQLCTEGDTQCPGGCLTAHWQSWKN